jgi:hypothetical protein
VTPTPGELPDGRQYVRPTGTDVAGHQSGLPQHPLTDRVALVMIGLEYMVVDAVERRGWRRRGRGTLNREDPL